MTGRIRGEAGPEVFVPTTDRGEQGPGALTTSPGPYGECICQPEPTIACRVHFPSYHQQPAPYTREEYDQLVHDFMETARTPGRLGWFESAFQLLHRACGEAAIDGDPRAVQALRMLRLRITTGDTCLEEW